MAMEVQVHAFLTSALDGSK